MQANGTTVLNLIGGLDKVFVIPPFQRNYEWSFEQCDELFEDILLAYKTNKTHYLGNVVYYEGDKNGASFNEFILVDGQQRITTILLILAAIIDITDNDKTRTSINNRYLKNDSDDSFRVRLKQTSYDELSFLSVIEGSNINEYDESNIVKNYKHFVQLIEQSKIDPIQIYETIPKLEIVDVNLSKNSSSLTLEAIQTVFEKINSTGKKLSAADLIRNYLLIANSSKDQEKLYKQYWVKIEQTIKNDNISRFARDYLIMNIFDEVPEDSVYKMFKSHFNEVHATHLDILQDLYSLSKYYAWLIFENSPNEKINHIMSYLNFLKTDVLYPLYLYLFKELFDSNTEELRKILNLLSDFMLRYRIVSPSGGGGDLRSVIHSLMIKLNEKEIELSYDSILFELSNSNTPAGRFPDNEEFYNVLTESVNNNYAKALLMKIEEFERKNIQVPINTVTIEHLMPQKLSDKWIDYLGGKEEAERIYYRYLNCIGNLTPMSGRYNAQNSNKPWDEKLEVIKEIQFVITNEIIKFKTWKEEDIINRNKDIAKRACSATASPLPRTRQYQTKTPSEEFIPGLYPITDISTPMSGTNVVAITFDRDKVYPVKSWRNFLNTICEITYELDSQTLRKIAIENLIHKATSNKNYPDKDPIITTNKTLLIAPIQIQNSEIYVEGCISANRARIYAKQLLDIYGLSDDFQIQVEK